MLFSSAIPLWDVCPLCWEHKSFRPNFGLDLTVECVGQLNERKIAKLRDVQHFVRNLTKIPYGVVLSIGGNDVDDSNSSVDSFTAAVATIFHQLHAAGVYRVEICSILPRKKPNNVSPTTYAMNTRRVNSILILMMRNPYFRRFVYIYQFGKDVCNKDMFVPDGVHFNMSGMWRYYNNIKDAIHKVRRLGRRQDRWSEWHLHTKYHKQLVSGLPNCFKKNLKLLFINTIFSQFSFSPLSSFLQSFFFFLYSLLKY